jgi:chaperonin GroES
LGGVLKLTSNSWILAPLNYSPNKNNNNNMKIKPLGERVLLKRIEEDEQIRGGIIIPDSAKEKSQEAEVVAIGTGKKDDAGKAIPFNVKIGDKVLLPSYGGTPVKVDGVEYILIDEDSILGVIA